MRKKFDVNPRAETKMGNGEQAHSEIAEIDAEGVKLVGSGEHLHGCVQQLTRAATPVWLKGAFENHARGLKDQGSSAMRRAQVTEVQWRGRSKKLAPVYGSEDELGDSRGGCLVGITARWDRGALSDRDPQIRIKLLLLDHLH